MNYPYRKINTMRSLVKSRANLREISNNPKVLLKYHWFDTAVDVIDEEVTKRVQEKKTRYTFDGTHFARRIQPIQEIVIVSFPPVKNKHFYGELMENNEFRNEFIEILKREYPDCTIEHTEPRIEDGKIIFPSMYIDWS